MTINVENERARVERVRARQNGEREAAIARAEQLRPECERLADAYVEAARAFLRAHEALRTVGGDVWQIGKESGWWGDEEVPEPPMELARMVRDVVLRAVREDPAAFVPMPRSVRPPRAVTVRVVGRDGEVRWVPEDVVSFHDDGAAFVDPRKQARRAPAGDPDPPAGVDGVVEPSRALMGPYREVDDRGRFRDA